MKSFPRKLAEGMAFCNRDATRKKLAQNISSQEHTVIISPRRYGKTSLVLKVLDDMSIPFVHVDFFLAMTADRVIERLLAAIANTLNDMMSINHKAVLAVKEFFKSFHVSLDVGPVSLGLKLEASQKAPEAVLLEALQGLEAFLIKHNKTAAFFIDEIQDIVNLPVCHEVEAAIRFFAQQSQHIAFIFSGSQRKLLQEIFDDRARPLFKMCDRINLGRIADNEYQKHLNKAASEKWQQLLPDDVFETIIQLTECHAYYVNYLCAELWRDDSMPTAEQVITAWLSLCETEAASLASSLNGLSQNQKDILFYIAKQGIWRKVTSTDSLSDLRLTSRGVTQSLKGLLDKDFVEAIKTDDEASYRLIDPLMKQLLLNA